MTTNNASSISYPHENIAINNGILKTDNPSWLMYRPLGSPSPNPATPVSPPNVVTYVTEEPTTTNCTVNTSTGRMTATVAGRYYVTFNGFLHSNATYGQIYIRKNGTIQVRAFSNKSSSGTFGPSIGTRALLDLAVGDYVDVYSSQQLHGNGDCIFMGFMIG